MCVFRPGLVLHLSPKVRVTLTLNLTTLIRILSNVTSGDNVKVIGKRQCQSFGTKFPAPGTKLTGLCELVKRNSARGIHILLLNDWFVTDVLSIMDILSCFAFVTLRVIAILSCPMIIHASIELVLLCVAFFIWPDYLK